MTVMAINTLSICQGDNEREYGGGGGGGIKMARSNTKNIDLAFVHFICRETRGPTGLGAPLKSEKPPIQTSPSCWKNLPK